MTAKNGRRMKKKTFEGLSSFGSQNKKNFIVDRYFEVFRIIISSPIINYQTKVSFWF